MRRDGLVGIAMAAVALLLLAHTQSSRASDHEDADAPCDIADLYSWMTPDADRLVLAATLGAGFSSGCQYVFHTGSMDAFDAEDATPTDIICHYDDVEDVMSCWVGEPNNPGGGAYQSFVDADLDTVEESEDGMVTLFAGERDDPFFFNWGGFDAAVESMRGALAGLVPGDFGCPIIDATMSMALMTQLGTDADGNPGIDDLAGENTSALVIEVDKTLINSGGDIISVWASTRER